MNTQAEGFNSEPLKQRLPVPFVLITGGKGGVGKTAVAANLAIALARRGRRVLLCDLDFGLANLHVAFGVDPKRTLEDFLSGGVALADCLHPCDGLWLLPAGSGSADMARPDSARRNMLWRGLRELANRFDVIVGDSAAGIGPDVLAFASAADYTLLVTQPDPAALADAYGLLKGLSQFAALRHLAVPTPEVLVNAAASPQAAEALATRLTQVAQRFLSRQPRLAGWLPRSQELAASGLSQRPLLAQVGNSLAAAALMRLAERIEQLTLSSSVPHSA
jgi:flagellar biosynthesis protein FlhG